MLSAQALDGLPEISAGDDLGALIAQALPPDEPLDRSILIIAHKAVSKAEGRVRVLSEVEPGPRAA